MTKKEKILKALWASEEITTGLSSEDINYIASHLPDEDKKGTNEVLEDDSAVYNHDAKDYVAACGLTNSDMNDFIEELKKITETKYGKAGTSVSSVIQIISKMSRKDARTNRVVSLVAYKFIEQQALRDKMMGFMDGSSPFGGGMNIEDQVRKIIDRIKRMEEDKNDEDDDE